MNVSVASTAGFDLAGRRVTVMGLGRFGGGVGVTKWLCSRGADVLVTDRDSAESLAGSLESIRHLTGSGQVSLRLGDHNVSDFTTCDLVVANAAVPRPWDDRFLRAAEAARIPITTEIALLIGSLPDGVRRRTVGVTGSVGKSTTTAMIHHGLLAAAAALGSPEASRMPVRRVLMGGNIGGSLLERLPEIDDQTWLVLELSSAMLYWLGRDPATRGWSPGVAVVTNLSPNHLDWHGDLAHYAESKQQLLVRQQPGDVAVLGESVWTWRDRTVATPLRIDPRTFTPPMSLPGEHNRANAAAALAACAASMPDADRRTIETAIAGFGGLVHRLQLVRTTPLPGRPGEPARFYNDSKSTTPESCLKAVDALASMPGFSSSRIHLIAGGYDKGVDLGSIVARSADLAGLYTIGTTGPRLAAAAGEAGRECGTLERAFAAALGRMQPGDALLLSPGCASWDQFVNFEQRGEAFVRLVEGIRP